MVRENKNKFQSLWRRADARNVSLLTLYGDQFFVFNSVVNTKLHATLFHRRSSTVSLETYLLYSRINYLNEKRFLMPWRLKVPNWKINFCSKVLRLSELGGKAANCHMMLRMVREIKVSSDWFGCVLVISFYVAMVFSKSVTWSSSCFINV